MENNPIEGVFWYAENMKDKNYQIKSGGFT